MPAPDATEGPVLQVALDDMNLHRALGFAEEALAGGADWLEAGTPLIKAEGMEAIRRLRKAFPDTPLFADLKTIDVGALEAEMAAKAGADVVGILALSEDGVIQEAVQAAERYDAAVMLDLIEHPDPVARAREAVEWGVRFVNVHVGIDAQMKGEHPLDRLREVARAVDVPVAAAGGINSETAAEVVKAGARIVIVGGAIIKAPSPKEAAAAVKEAMTTGKAVTSELYKKYTEADLREAFTRVSSSNVSDAMHHKGAMRGLSPYLSEPETMRAVGPATTVRTANGDWAKPVEAIDACAPGGVLVVDARGGDRAVWGELASWSCKQKGIAGVVVDGAIRDVQDILEMGFPAWAKSAVPDAGDPKGFGEVDVPVECAGQIVRPGDWIVADVSGVTVVPKERAVEVANRALNVLEFENRLREEIQRGSTLAKRLDLYKWEKVR